MVLIRFCLARSPRVSADRIIEIDEGVLGPEFLSDLLAVDNLADSVEEKNQNPERLLLKPNPDALP
jgi:hypothetical protein